MPANCCPLTGYTLDDAPIDDLALEQALARNNLILEFAAEPPETAAAHRIRMNTLGGLLLQIQALGQVRLSVCAAGPFRHCPPLH